MIAQPKFRRWFDELAARQLAECIERDAVVLPDVGTPAITRDRNDDHRVALARPAEATELVSGEPDLREADIAASMCAPRVVQTGFAHVPADDAPCMQSDLNEAAITASV